MCLICGLESPNQPTCIECDMTLRTRMVLARDGLSTEGIPLTRTPHVYESDLVHLVVRHPRTGRYGSIYTPTSEISTFCRYAWELRPRRARVRELVTCPTCAGAPKELFAREEP